MKKILVIIFILCGINELAADATGILTGRVRDKTTQSPISGVTVSLQGTRMGTYTSSDGSYKIEEIPPGVYSVKFRSLGYEEYIQSDVVINSGRPASLDAERSETVIRLEGAEVRGSYFPKKVETATSTQSLNSEDIRRAPGVQEDVLRATALLPGVNVTAAGRNDLIVRGGAPFENLFIVDNLEVNNINHFGSQGSTGGPLSIINL
ncbi:MAG: carboxypeptidase regulatory-like domain-containing protein, partial [Bacteroidota bacterium]